MRRVECAREREKAAGRSVALVEEGEVEDGGGGWCVVGVGEEGIDSRGAFGGRVEGEEDRGTC